MAATLVTVEAPSPVNPRFAPPATLRLRLLRATARYLVLAEPTPHEAHALSHSYGLHVSYGGEAYFDRAASGGLRSPKGGDMSKGARSGGDWSAWRLEQAAWSQWYAEPKGRESCNEHEGLHR